MKRAELSGRVAALDGAEDQLMTAATEYVDAQKSGSAYTKLQTRKNLKDRAIWYTSVARRYLGGEAPKK